MAAPEYLIKLKFGTDVDKKAFNEIQEAYNNLNKKQQATFAKQYGSSVQEMNKIFQKEMRINLQEYEKAAIKTERTLTAARVRELREYIAKRDAQFKRLPGFAAGAVGTAGIATARSAIMSSTSLTGFEKNRYSNAMSLGYAGAVGGGMIAGPIGALVGGGAGIVSALAMSHFEDGAEAIRRSGELFNNAVSVYRNTINFTKGMTAGMAGAGFTDVGEYQVYKQALKNVGIENDSFMNDLARSLLSQKGTEGLGASLINMRRDQGLQLLYEQWQKSGLTAREFVMNPTSKGGINQSDFRADALIALFESGGLQAAITKVLGYIVAPGGKASDISADIKKNEAKRLDLENREWASAITNIRQIADIDMNPQIMEEADRAFQRSVHLMKESDLILTGVVESYRTHEKELAKIFAHITRKTGRGTVFAEERKTALNRGLQTGDYEEFYDIVGSGSSQMSFAKPMQSKIEKASERVSRVRAENRPMSINNF